MKAAPGFASILLLGSLTQASFAAGIVSINWDGCTGPVDKTPLPAAPAQKIVLSVLGHDQPHKAYDVRILLGQPGGLKDAWRFDDGGCEGPTGYAIQVVDAKTCPAFMQTATGLQIRKYTFDPTTGLATGLLANAYTAILSSDAATRYLLASFQFDLSSAVPGAGNPPNTCGGLDALLCVQMSNTSWLTLDGQEIRWDQGLFFVTGNDPYRTWCAASVPAQPKTWGSLKNQYRN